MKFSKWVTLHEADTTLQRWVVPLEQALRPTTDIDARIRRKTRQRLLRYGVVVHALIDTLDPKHRTTRDRIGYPNKLTRRSKRELIGLFDTFLPQVRETNIQKYTGVSR